MIPERVVVLSVDANRCVAMLVVRKHRFSLQDDLCQLFFLKLKYVYVSFFKSSHFLVSFKLNIKDVIFFTLSGIPHVEIKDYFTQPTAL